MADHQKTHHGLEPDEQLKQRLEKKEQRLRDQVGSQPNIDVVAAEEDVRINGYAFNNLKCLLMDPNADGDDEEEPTLDVHARQIVILESDDDKFIRVVAFWAHDVRSIDLETANLLGIARVHLAKQGISLCLIDPSPALVKTLTDLRIYDQFAVATSMKQVAKHHPFIEPDEEEEDIDLSYTLSCVLQLRTLINIRGFRIVQLDQKGRDYPFVIEGPLDPNNLDLLTGAILAFFKGHPFPENSRVILDFNPEEIPLSSQGKVHPYATKIAELRSGGCTDVDESITSAIRLMESALKSESNHPEIVVVSGNKDITRKITLDHTPCMLCNYLAELPD